MPSSAVLLLPWYFFATDSSKEVSFYLPSGTWASMFPVRMDISIRGRARSVVLPNGAKYDPYQTYTAPDTPGEATVQTLLKPTSAAVDISYVESQILSLYNVHAEGIGLHGTLYAHDSGGAAATATCRFIGLNVRHSDYPRIIPTSMGGPGLTTKGIMTAEFIYTFDLLSQWTFA